MSVVEALRETGLTVHSMADVYGEEKAQRLAEEVWLRDAGKKNWVVLTKDDAIRRRPAERDALTEAAVRCFCLKPGPYIYGVYESGLKHLWP